MKSILEVGPPAVASLKKRTIRDLAMGRIEDSNCFYITKRLDEIEAYIADMKEREEAK